MVTSMTGYGRAEAAGETVKFTVEMKSVNNRFLDFNIRMPRNLSVLEAQVRSELKKYMQRGKVDVYVSYENLSEETASVQYNHALAAQYFEYLKRIAGEFSLEQGITAATLAGYPDVLKMEEEETDTDALWEVLKEALDGAAEQFLSERRREGEFLKNDILEKLSGMEEHAAFISERAPQITARYRETLRQKIKDMLGEASVDEGRILTEAAVYADRVCIDEELVRLSSHIAAMRDTLLNEKDAVGRKMDFLAQEMNRESNTILSKSDDLEVSDHAIELKTCVEKIREQVQNME
ncbi:MAG: YicC family protein [Lachnospiraceae bacterium]|nr:YicC family protein [Lachnospiraceae bacterium]